MEILILIGIFAFVIAIIFRSNEALNRVGEVEKEVKQMEEEIGHKVPASQSAPAEPVALVETTKQEPAPAEQPVATISHEPTPESVPVLGTEAAPAPIVHEQTTVPEVNPAPAAELSPVEPVSVQQETAATEVSFPSAASVHMN